eukprot:XP_011669929.1 PREDICTED: putative nuclease HARBI1 [Strongylocentrotus purpuratus]
MRKSTCKMAAMVEEAVGRALRRERVFRDRTNPLDAYCDTELRKRYRFSRRGCIYLIHLLRIDLEHPTGRSRALPASLQIFLALAFFASGALLTTVGTMHGISIASTSRAIRRVTKALFRRRNQFIKFPKSERDVLHIQEQFFAVAGFPKVVGVIDCTHVHLHGSKLKPIEHLYVNRKNRHSINVQLICGPDFLISNVVARWPGSTHDSRILQMSRLARKFEQREYKGILLGDS